MYIFAHKSVISKSIQPLSKIQTLNGQTVRVISSVGKKKAYEGNDLRSSEWKTERVREDASGDRKDGEEDDELSCVIDNYTHLASARRLRRQYTLGAVRVFEYLLALA